MVVPCAWAGQADNHGPAPQTRPEGASTNTRPARTRVARCRLALSRSLHAVQDFYAHPNWVELGDDVLVDQSLTVTRSSTKTRAPCPVARRSIERRSRSRSDRHAMSGADSISSLTMRGRCWSPCPRRIRSRRSAHHRKRASRRPAGRPRARGVGARWIEVRVLGAARDRQTQRAHQEKLFMMSIVHRGTAPLQREVLASRCVVAHSRKTARSDAVRAKDDRGCRHPPGNRRTAAQEPAEPRESPMSAVRGPRAVLWCAAPRGPRHAPSVTAPLGALHVLHREIRFMRQSYFTLARVLCVAGAALAASACGGDEGAYSDPAPDIERAGTGSLLARGRLRLPAVRRGLAG
ncbi:hypothetical protein [Sorangium atrum]|uniref:hypothetical protein n=1 Tax=Sorangium atrum TaxID=2995308 RepID=UPI0040329EA5